MTDFIRAIVTASVVNSRPVESLSQVDAWADAEITDAKLQPLMEGEIVTRHSGTEDGQWQCAYEFTVPGRSGDPRRYQWSILGPLSGSIVETGVPVGSGGVVRPTRSANSHSSTRPACDRTPCRLPSLKERATIL